MNPKRTFSIALSIILAVVLLVALGACVPKEQPVPRSADYNCSVYTEQGCAKFVVASGGEIEVQSGGTVDVQAGATFNVSATTKLPNGSASAPALAFINDTDSGVYRVGANNLGMAVSATLISDWSSTGLDMNTKLIENIGAAGTDFKSDGSLSLAGPVTPTTRVAAPNGTVSLPGIAFGGDTDNGLYYIGANEIGLALGGALKWDYSSTGTSFTGGQLNMPDGTMAAPILRFTNDIDTGFCRVTTNTLGISAGGAGVAEFNASGAIFTGTFTLEGVAFTGPVVGGCAASIANNGTIAHGLGTTPTVPILIPMYAGTFTQTVYVSATNSTNIYVGLSTGSQANVTVCWMAMR